MLGGPEFNYQHPLGGSQPSITSSEGSNALFWCVDEHADRTPIYILYIIYIHILHIYRKSHFIFPENGTVDLYRNVYQ